ncbi:MAG: caspase family protein [Burkholderiales bacterium]
MAGSLFAPLPYAWVWAQQDAREGALKLLKAPKVALVVGNGAYKDAPVLKNAPNDAKAVSEALKASGFAVTTLIDTGREALVKAIRGYVNGMEQKKAVGLFYFAGHGVQLDWRNYMLPVDAVIDTVEDVGKQSVDVARLMEGLTKAANPMNVIILDACREDPFGKAKKAPQKGLSQMDAPTQTILAYATSPGNVASDGDGVNGLYTENLLREMKVPEAKIEDVFKRVRLGVRRKTNGAQIPWESTSLEDDFWFLPPRELKAASDAEKDKLFEEELAQWEKIKESMDPAPLEAFLRRWPSGPFSELAQLQLDRALAKQGEKKVQIVQAAGNPYTQGTVLADMDFKVGDYYGYVTLDRTTRAELGRIPGRITAVTDTEVIIGNGAVILDRLGNTIKLPNGNRFSPRQDQPTEYAIGKKWTTRYSTTGAGGRTGESEFEFRITKREKITVPAGTFDCYVIEGDGYAVFPHGKSELKLTRWMAPDKVRRPIVTEQYRKFERSASAPGGSGGPGALGRRGPGMDGAPKGPGGKPPSNIDERMELVEYKQT